MFDSLFFVSFGLDLGLDFDIGWWIWISTLALYWNFDLHLELDSVLISDLNSGFWFGIWVWGL
jgi:hypothetical protein